MSNAYYSPTGNPATGSEGLSSLIRTEFATISTAFDLLPTIAGNGGKAVVVNGGGTALGLTTGTLALAGNFSTTGAFNTIFAQAASVTITLPGITGTLATLAGAETLSNKTLIGPALGTPVSGVMTNVTGTAAGLTAGTATNQSGGTVSATTLAASGLASLAGGVNAAFSQPAATHTTLGWLTGTQTFGGTIPFSFAPMNILQITDALAVTGASGLGQGFWIQLNTGGSTVKGGRSAIQGDMVIASATGNAGNGQYVGVQGNAFLPAGVSEPGGIIYGANFTSQLFTGASTGATGNGYVVGVEIDVGAQAGTVTRAVVGLSIIPFGNWSVPGTLGNDTAIGFGDQGQVGGGWDTLINLVGLTPGHLPIKTTGRLFWAQTTGTIAKGFDLLNLTITGDAWSSTELSIFGAPFNNTSLGTKHGIMLGTGVIAGADVNITTSNGSNIALVPTGTAVVKVAGNLQIQNPTASQVNLIQMTGATTGNLVNIFAQGSDANVGMNISGQGSGGLNIRTDSGNRIIAAFVGSTASDGFVSIIPGIAASRPLQFFANGTANNILVGGSSAGGGGVATAATTGFLMIPFTSGVPTGVPVNSGSGAAISVNTISQTINVYVPGVGLCHVALTAGAA